VKVSAHKQRQGGDGLLARLIIVNILSRGLITVDLTQRKWTSGDVVKERLMCPPMDSTPYPQCIREEETGTRPLVLPLARKGLMNF